MKKSIVLFLALQPQIYTMENEIPQEIWRIKKTIQHNLNIKSTTYNSISNQVLILDEKNVTLTTIDNEKQSVIFSHSSNLWKPSFDPSSRYIITTPSEEKIILSNLEGKEIACITPEDYPKIVKFNHQGNQILIVNSESIELRNLDGTLIKNLNQPKYSVKIAKFFPNDTNLIFLAPGYFSQKKCKLWDVRDKNLIPYNYIDRLKKVSIHKDGMYIACTRQNERATFVYDLRKQGEAPLLYTNHAQLAKFNSQGTHILTKHDYLALLWKMQCVIEHINTQKYVDFTLQLNSDNVSSATFHPNGNKILTHSKKNIFYPENNFRIWDLDGNQLAKLVHEKTIYSAEYDKTGNYIISTHTQDNIKSPIVTLWQKAE